MNTQFFHWSAVEALKFDDTLCSILPILWGTTIRSIFSIFFHIFVTYAWDQLHETELY